MYISEQQSTEAALAAKDATIGQLQRELQDLRAKLAVSTHTHTHTHTHTVYVYFISTQDADNRLLQVTTTKAAELVSKDLAIILFCTTSAVLCVCVL